MELTIIEKEGNRLKFLINGIETPIANALRRIMIAEVPSMAIDDVIIIENSSPIKDEVLSHRLGLIPLRTDLDSYNLPEKCTCNSEIGCNKCSVTLTLEVEAQQETQTVYSRGLISNNPDIIPISENIPMMKLGPGQKIRLEAYAKLGIGKVHAKWQPVSACSYKYASVIEIEDKKCDLCRKCIEYCSKKILRVENGSLSVFEAEKCNLCGDCMKTCSQQAIKIERVKNAFIFNIESTGALPSGRILYEAVKTLKKKNDTFIEQLFELKKR